MPAWARIGGAWQKVNRPPFCIIGGGFTRPRNGYVKWGGIWRPIWANPLNNVLALSFDYGVDKVIWCSYSFRTRLLTWTPNNWHNSPYIQNIVDYVQLQDVLGQYQNFNVTLGYNNGGTSYGNGRPNITITDATPSPSNDWSFSWYLEDPQPSVGWGNMGFNLTAS